MAERSQGADASNTDADASRLKQIEAQLQRMTKVFMDGADPIVVRDMDGNVLDVNRETERVFGWTRDELLGRRTKHLLAPEYQELADETLQRVQQGETIRNLEAEVRTKSGELVPVLATVFLLTEENNEPVGYAEIVKDITQMKSVTEKLERRNRDLRHFANILAHDLGAPLRSVRRFAELLREDCGDGLDEECGEHLQFIVNGVAQMDRLIEDLLRYTRLEGHQVIFESVDCGKVYDQALANLNAAIIEDEAQVTSDPLPTVPGNRTQLVQLFQNLIGNAIKFRRLDKPKVHVSAEECEGGWKFSVRDDGIGIDERYVEKVFDVFQRLHAENVFPGTGIGLAICKAIVERHGGRIWVESEKGTGSTFYFTISDQTSAQ